MTLMLHRGDTAVEYDGLRELDTPPATPTHIPIPHFRVVDLVKTAVGMYGHEVVTEHHGVTEDGNRYFGLLSLRSPYTGYEDTVGLRNIHDKSFPVSTTISTWSTARKIRLTHKTTPASPCHRASPQGERRPY